MKKYGMLLLALLACCMMALGCSSDEEKTEAPETEEVTEAETEEETDK